MSKIRVIHYYRWRSPNYLILCGNSNGWIMPNKPGWEVVTCKSCIKIGKAKGWYRLDEN